MGLQRLVVIGALGAALAVPAGLTIANASTTTPTTTSTATADDPQPRGQGWGRRDGSGQGRGPGGGYGRGGGQGARVGDDCPAPDSAEMKAWRDGREERQAAMREQHGKDWTPPRDGTGPFHEDSPRAACRVRPSATSGS